MTLTDIDIARQARPQPIDEIAQKLDLPKESLEIFGTTKAKVSNDYLSSLKPRGKLILVTAVSPTPAGEGKTTTSVGLGDGLNALGKRVAVCLREPSLGPCFGVKGGAAGGGMLRLYRWRSSTCISRVTFMRSGLRITCFLRCWTITFTGVTRRK